MIEILAAMASASGALKSASEITKTLLETKDSAVVRAKVIELNGQIITAQTSTLAAQTSQFELLEKVRSLEKEVADLEAWDTEKRRYNLTAVGQIGFAYALKGSMSQGEPPHWLCTGCYTQSKKSILQGASGLEQGTHNYEKRWVCHKCALSVMAPYTTLPTYSNTGDEIASP